jgi:hypothetical protein
VESICVVNEQIGVQTPSTCYGPSDGTDGATPNPIYSLSDPSTDGIRFVQYSRHGGRLPTHPVVLDICIGAHYVLTYVPHGCSVVGRVRDGPCSAYVRPNGRLHVYL